LAGKILFTLEKRVEGLTIVKGVITVEGKAENCRMIKALPHREKAVLDALAAQKFMRVTFQSLLHPSRASKAIGMNELIR
jgi:hypothetical protein